MEKALGLATAFVTLVGTALGVYSIHTTRKNEQVKSVVVEQSESADATIRSLQKKNEELAAELEELRKSLQPTPAGSKVGEPQLRHTGIVSLAAGGDKIDLNAPADDDKWSAGAEVGSPDAIGLDVESIAFFNSSGWSEGTWARLDEAATYRACLGATVYAPHHHIPVADLQAAKGNCFRLSNGRYAAVRVVQFKNNVVTLEITTWEAGS